MSEQVKHTPTPIILICQTCGIIPLLDDEGGCHIVAGHGQHDENGECAECPIPEQCGPITYYVPKSHHDSLEAKVEELTKFAKEAIKLLRDVERRCDKVYICESFELEASVVSIDEDDFYLSTGLNRDEIDRFLRENEALEKAISKAKEE